ncbi:hypothetical protein [Shewanella gaetbuli]
MKSVSPKAQQQGAILAEFIVITGFVFIPLALMLPLLFKFIEVKQYTEQASRYAVWERVAYYQTKPKNRDDYAPVKTDQQLQYEVQNRILAAAQTPIYLAQSTKKVSEPSNSNLLINHFGKGSRGSVFAKPRRQSDAFVNSSTEQHGLPKASRLSGIVGEVLSFAPGFELNQKGLYQTTISSDMRMYDWFPELGNKPMTIQRTNALLAEGWSIGGPEQVKSELKYLVPITAALNDFKFESLFKILSYIPLAKELKWLELAKIEPDAVPCVRLGDFDRRGRVTTPKGCKKRLIHKMKKMGHNYK